MKVRLMHADAGFDPDTVLPRNTQALNDDLGLRKLVGALAGGDKEIAPTVTTALLCGLREPEAINYRQAVLRDCLANREFVRTLYALAGDAIADERHEWSWSGASASSLAQRSVRVMGMLLERCRQLRTLAAENATKLESDGFRELCETIAANLSEDYIAQAGAVLAMMSDKRGVLAAVRLGRGNRGTDYRLLVHPQTRWFENLGLGTNPKYSFRVADRDEAGARALTELCDRAFNDSGSALAQALEHVLSFFRTLRREVGFYVGALNLIERLEAIGAPSCLPVVGDQGESRWRCRELYDVCLALRTQRPPTGNELDSGAAHLTLVTGANRGGKSTFLRSYGLAQLMAQAGLFVAAAEFQTNVHTGVFTHFKRPEDETMHSGKLVEELERMDELVDQMAPGGLLLANEPFASTNELEGAEIGRALFAALIDAGVQVICVTHQFVLASRLRTELGEDIYCLRAQPPADDERAFKLAPAPPETTSHGIELYDRIIGPPA